MQATGIRKDVLTFMPLNCQWSKDLTEKVHKTCLDKSALRGWIPIKMHIVDNPDLEEAFEDRKAELKKKGRTESELREELCFMAESWKSVVSMCKYGVRCSQKKTNILGDTRTGLHLNRHYDMLLRFMTYRNFITARCVVVFRVIPGRIKRVMPRFQGRTLLHPSKHYDAHVSVMDPDPHISVNEGLANNFIYIYQLDEETLLPVEHPRQVVPYAVIQLRPPYKATVNRPFTSFRDRFLARTRSLDTRDRHASKSRRTTETRSSRKPENRHKSSDKPSSSTEKRHSDRHKHSSERKEPKALDSSPGDIDKLQVTLKENVSDKSSLQTKLQKIEEEIKLRQSKLTKLRDIKSSHEKSTQGEVKSEDSENMMENTSTLDAVNNEFAPKIVSVYSTSSFDKVKTDKGLLSEYRELSSGASTPTMDEPGDQKINDKLSPLKECSDKEEREENGHNLHSDKTEVGNHSKDNEMKDNTQGHEITIKGETKQEQKSVSIIEKEKVFNKEKCKQDMIDKQDLQKQTHGGPNVDLVGRDVKNESSVEDTETKSQESCRKEESKMNTSTDIKMLFREAIFQMDPSDLYELLTEKLSEAGNDIEIDTGDVRDCIDIPESGTDSEDVVLDLSCRNTSVVDNNKVNSCHKSTGEIIQSTIVNTKSVGRNVEKDSSSVAALKQDSGITVKNMQPKITETKNDPSYMSMDNLDILASVALELRSDKNTSINSMQTHSRDKLSDKEIVVTNIGKNKCQPITAIVHNPGKRNTLQLLDNTIYHKQDMENVGKTNTLKGNDKKGKSLQTLDTKHILVFTSPKDTVCISTNNNAANTTQLSTENTSKTSLKVAEKSVVKKSKVHESVNYSNLVTLTEPNRSTHTFCKRSNASEEQERKKENENLQKDGSHISDVIASTKRKTANSVAAAFAASEQSKDCNVNVKKQSPKRSPKQRNTKTCVSKTCETTDKESPRNVKPTEQSILKNSASLSDTKISCRENLFEKFASSETIAKSQASNTLMTSKSQSENNEQPKEENAKSNEIANASVLIKQEPLDRESDDICYSNVDKQKQFTVKSSDNGNPKFDIIIKQEPPVAENCEINKPILASNKSPSRNRIGNSKETQNKSNLPITDLDNTIVEIMAKKVTESMQDSENQLTPLCAIVKKEPMINQNELSICSKENIANSNIQPTDQRHNDRNVNCISSESKNTSPSTIPQVVVKKEPIDEFSESSSSTTIGSTMHLSNLPKKSTSVPVNNVTVEEEKSTKGKNTLITQNKVTDNTNSKIGTNESTSQTNNISSEIHKTLKDLEQVIGVYSQKVRQNSDISSNGNNQTDDKLNNQENVPKSITEQNPDEKPKTQTLSTKSAPMVGENRSPEKRTEIEKRMSNETIINLYSTSNKKDATDSISSVKNHTQEVGLNKSKTTATPDDSVRTTRVLQAALDNSFTPNKIGNDVQKRIKQETITGDHYYGISGLDSLQSGQKKVLENDNHETTVSHTNKKGDYLVHNKNFGVSVRGKERTVDLKSTAVKRVVRGYQKHSGHDKLDMTHSLSSTTYKTNDRRTLNVNATRISPIKNRLFSNRLRNRSYSKSPERSRSSSIDESQGRNVNNSRKRSRSPIEYQYKDNSSWYVKSKWDSDEGSGQATHSHSKYRAIGHAHSDAYKSRYSNTDYTSKSNQNFTSSIPNFRNKSHTVSQYTDKDQSSHSSPSLSYNTWSSNLSQNNSRSTNTTYSKDTIKNHHYSRISVKRERSSSSERGLFHSYKNSRSRSNEKDKRYNHKRHRSDSKDRMQTKLTEQKRHRSSSRDRSSRNTFRRTRSRSNERKRVSSFEARKRIDSSRMTEDEHKGRFALASSSRAVANEDDVTSTLSKAMSTLLKKIIFDDKARDDSKEGRMADMVLDMVKAHVNVGQNLNLTPVQHQKRAVSTRSDTHDRTSFNQSHSDRHQTGRTDRSNISSISRSAYNNISSRGGRPVIFNSILKYKYNPNYKTPWRSNLTTRPFSRDSFHSRGRGRLTSSRGLSRTITSRGLSRDISNRGPSRDITIRGLSRDISNRGLSRNVANRGLSRDSTSRGISRHISNRGHSQYTSSRGQSGHASHRGNTQELRSSGVSTDPVKYTSKERKTSRERSQSK